jgi:uncharacterized protein YndB with AHSA1/START domain
MNTNKPQFVYVTYIASTPEKVFDALINPEIVKEYWWRHNNASDWKVGSRWEHQQCDNPQQVEIVGKVLEFKPPHRMVITWSKPADEGKPEKTSRVTFDIASHEGSVRLIVTHDDLEPESKMLHDISQGWPMVLSALKSLLETGETLPMAKKGKGCK